jgi:hypothetical protein
LHIFGYNIFCNDATVGAGDRGQSYGVIAAACANISNGHPGFDAQQLHKLTWFAGIVALPVVVPDWADDVRARAIGLWKGDSRRDRPRIKSCAETDRAIAAAKMAAIVVRVASPTHLPALPNSPVIAF